MENAYVYWCQLIQALALAALIASPLHHARAQSVSTEPPAPPSDVPGLQRVPGMQLPDRGQQSSVLQSQPACPVPTIVRPGFSATQIAFLVTELQASISPGCYALVTTSLATCLEDLSLVSGCCTAGCYRALREAVTPECLVEFWQYICNNQTAYADYVAGVVNRCVPAAAGLQLGCPVNRTQIASLLKRGSLAESVGALLGDRWNQSAGNITVAGIATLAPPRAAGEEPVRNDTEYYTECALQTPQAWSDFNSSFLYESLLAFARDVPQECLRSALSYLPSCYDDLLYETGCCSLRCRAAIEQVDLSCFISYLKSLCERIPKLTKYFFNAAQRCASINITCQGVVGGSTIFSQFASTINTASSKTSGNLPLVASSTGQCPLTNTTWAEYNAADVPSATTQLMSQSSLPCRQHVPRIGSACHGELGIQLGCCTYNCAIVMRSVPDNCHEEFKTLLCAEPATAKYTVALADRCLGTGAYECPGHKATNSTGV